MGFITLGLGLLFVFIGLLSLKRGRVFASGRLTRSKITGKGMQAIAIPQVVAGAIVALIGLADLIRFDAIGQYTSAAVLLLIGTYLVTNLGLGGFFQAKSTIESARKPRGG